MRGLVCGLDVRAPLFRRALASAAPLRLPPVIIQLSDETGGATMVSATAAVAFDGDQARDSLVRLPSPDASTVVVSLRLARAAGPGTLRPRLESVLADLRATSPIRAADILLVHADELLRSGGAAAVAAALLACTQAGLAKAVALDTDMLDGFCLRAVLDAGAPLSAVAYPASLAKFPVPSLPEHDWEIGKLARRAGIAQIAKSALDVTHGRHAESPFRCATVAALRGRGAPLAPDQMGDVVAELNSSLNAAVNLELAWMAPTGAARAAALESERAAGGAAYLAGLDATSRDLAWGRTVATNLGAFVGTHGSALLWAWTKQNCMAPAVEKVVRAVLMAIGAPGGEGEPALPQGGKDVSALSPREWAVAYMAAIQTASSSMDAIVSAQHMTAAAKVARAVSEAFPELESPNAGGTQTDEAAVAGLAGNVVRLLLSPATGLDAVLVPSDGAGAEGVRPSGGAGEREWGARLAGLQGELDKIISPVE
jgi:hypothetical protein